MDTRFERHQAERYNGPRPQHDYYHRYLTNIPFQPLHVRILNDVESGKTGLVEEIVRSRYNLEKQMDKRAAGFHADVNPWKTTHAPPEVRCTPQCDLGR